jgi:hypothetical protein
LDRKQTVKHQLFNCRKWRKQRKKFNEELVKLGLFRPRDGGQIDKDKLFNNLLAYNVILAFLDATDIGLRANNMEKEEEKAYNQDSWDLESLNSSISTIESSL